MMSRVSLNSTLGNSAEVGGGDVGLHGVHLESRSCLGQMDQTKMESMGSESFPLLSQRLGWVGQDPGTLERFEFDVR